MKALLTRSSDCHRRPNRLRFHDPYGQNLHLVDVSSDLRHSGLQEGHMDRRSCMRCMGHSCNLLPHIPVPTFFWTLESRRYFHGQVHRPTGLLQSHRLLQHGTRHHHSLHAIVYGLEIET